MSGRPCDPEPGLRREPIIAAAILSCRFHVPLCMSYVLENVGIDKIGHNEAEIAIVPGVNQPRQGARRRTLAGHGWPGKGRFLHVIDFLSRSIALDNSLPTHCFVHFILLPISR